MQNWIDIAYLIAACLFVLGIKGLTKPKTAVRGNLLAAAGMGIAAVVTLLNEHIVTYEIIIAGVVVGGLIGAVMAKKVQMTAMPQMIALLNGFGGGASFSVASAEFFRGSATDTVSIIATGAAVLMLCFIFPPNVFWLMMFIGTVFASSWGPVGFMSIWSKSITASAAFWGIVSGFFGNVIPASLEYMGLINLPSYFNPALIGASISLITIICLSKRGNVTTQEAEYRENLHRTPDVDYDLQKTKTTMWAPAFLVIYGCVMPLLLIRYYVIPYQTALGQLLPDGTVDLSTGESILAMLTAPVYIILALIVAKVVWARYSPPPAENHAKPLPS